ncbi:omptin family outer membrane protease [Devosia sp. A449]
MAISPSIYRLGAGLVVLAMLTSGVMAQSSDYWDSDYWGNPQGVSQPSTPDHLVRFDASIGALFLEGNEKVLSGDYTVSHLIWQTKAPVLRGSLDINFGSGFSARAEGSVAGFGSSYMEDYDWLGGSDLFDNWTHRSQHSDTTLDHYVTGAASLGYKLARDGTAVVRAHGGFKYTDVQWSSRGGSFIYSDLGFRDWVGSFADGDPAISYRQQFPELFLGVDGDEHYGNFRVGGLLRGGLTFLSRTTDRHHMRNLSVLDDLWVAPTVTAGVDLGWALGRNAELTLAARYDHIFEQRGAANYYYDTPADGNNLSLPEGAGGGLRSAEITAGLKGLF